MARLIYAVLALALASLVAGFVVRTTAAPLIASVGLSAVVTVMILYGWSKRLRASGAFDEVEAEPSPDMEELDEMLVVEVDEAEITGEIPTRRRRREKVKAAATKTIDADLEFAPEPADAPDVTVVERAAKAKAKPKPKPKPKPKAKPKAKAPASKAKPKAKPAATRSRGSRVVVIPGAAKYHKKGCRFAKGDDLREVSAETARKRGYEPCGACKPG